MWSYIFPKLSHIFNLLDNIAIIILLENTDEIQKEIKGGNFVRINLLGRFIYNVIDRIRPFLENNKYLKFRGCMCKSCKDIALETSIKDLGILLESEIASLKGYINRQLNVLQYKMIKNGKVNLLMREQKMFLVRLMKALRHILDDLGNYYPLFIDSSNL